MSKKWFRGTIEMHPVVFPAAAVLAVGLAVLAAWQPARSMLFFTWLQGEIANRCGWLYISAMTGFLVFAVYLCCSRYGKLRLGPEDQPPEFPTLTWLAMLFSAGMGIGMLFFGVAEPMWHYLAPPTTEGETLAAARQALGITLFHWCLHPWSLYAVVGLALAFFSYRRGLPLSVRSVFEPLIGQRIYGRWGDAIDVLAVLATLIGLATSLGLGAKQVNAGLHYVFGVPQGIAVQVGLIAGITAMAVVSLVSGLHAGIRRLSELNMCLGLALLLFLFAAGPTRYLLNSLVENVGTYLQRLPQHSFWTAAYEDESRANWFANWTVFYWGWWIAWSPFVGMFIARISKGRTVREFIVGVLLVPSSMATIWMTGFGNAALHQEIHGQLREERAGQRSALGYAPRTYPVQLLDPASGLPQTEDGQWLVGPTVQGAATPIGVLLAQNEQGLVTKSGVAVDYLRGVLVDRQTREPFSPDRQSRHRGGFKAQTTQLTLGGYLNSPVLTEDRSSRIDTTATAMFVMLAAYPWSMVTALVGTLCVVCFFVTSSDSASMVVDMIASGGNENPTTATRVFWGILEGVLAAVLLVAGGLKALQTASITIGLPFCLLVIAMCYCLYLGLQRAAHDSDRSESPEHATERS